MGVVKLMAESTDSTHLILKSQFAFVATHEHIHKQVLDITVLVQP
jgi:hypothetical protein